MKLKIFRIMAIVTGLVGTTLFNRFLEGGALFMSLILICLLLSIYFIAKGFLTLSSNAEVSSKSLKHINDCGVLGITLGFIGAFIGLIGAFDAIEASGGPVAPSILAGGLKIALLSPLFGLFTFAVSRLGILILRVIQKQ
jgi:biopolymer transport protein ExbB/TolQ